MMVTIADVRSAKMCVTGAKIWLESKGYDFKAFLENGLPEAELLKWNDRMADQVVEAANGRRKKTDNRV